MASHDMGSSSKMENYLQQHSTTRLFAQGIFTKAGRKTLTFSDAPFDTDGPQAESANSAHCILLLCGSKDCVHHIQRYNRYYYRLDISNPWSTGQRDMACKPPSHISS